MCSITFLIFYTENAFDSSEYVYKIVMQICIIYLLYWVGLNWQEKEDF